jgi:hypothetical protein
VIVIFYIGQTHTYGHSDTIRLLNNDNAKRVGVAVTFELGSSELQSRWNYWLPLQENERIVFCNRPRVSVLILICSPCMITFSQIPRHYITPALEVVSLNNPSTNRSYFN